MKYSIITPCSYQDEDRIKELKHNLELQNFKDFEWIIISNDPKFTIKSSLLNYKVISSRCNNVASARNAGIRKANGKFIIFIDADDYILSKTLRRLDNVVKLCSSRESFVYDLNIYSTYEPEDSFISSLNISNHAKDYLPDQGITKSQRKPLCRYFNYNLENSVNNNYNEWLRNRYWLYNNEHKYDNLDHELEANGKVIPKSLLDNYHIIFNVHDDFYSNICFMLMSLEYSEGVVKLGDFNYIKVHHNNPISDPSISQINVTDRWELWLQSCFHSVLQLNDDTLINKFIYHMVLIINRYFYKDVITHNPTVAISRDLTFIELQKILQLVNLDSIKILGKRNNNINFLEQKILSNIKMGQFTKAIHEMNSLINFRNIHKVISQHGRGSTRDFYYLAQKLPVNSHVIFYESFLGRSFSDNPKYIYKYIQAHYPNKFLNVWSVDAKHYKKVKAQLKSQSNTLVVKRWGFKYMKYLATAKYFVDNMRQPKWFIKRSGMRFIETWHGTPLKKLVYDISYFGNEYNVLYREIFYHQSRQWDNLVTDNPFSYKVFKHAFMYPQSKMLKSGYPRNDILTRPDRDQLAKKIKIKLGIPLNKKVILYAPTWRDNQVISSGHYKFTLKLNIPLLKKYLGSSYVLVLRTHYFITNHLDTSSFGDFVFNESNYNDISELYLISDILITDYSSVFFDYAILDRPILYYVYDYKSYAKVLHGFYLNMKKDLPGPLITTSTGVLHAIQNIDDIKNKYYKRYRKFNRRFNSWDDGHASQRVVNALLNK